MCVSTCIYTHIINYFDIHLPIHNCFSKVDRHTFHFLQSKTYLHPITFSIGFNLNGDIYNRYAVTIDFMFEGNYLYFFLPFLRCRIRRQVQFVTLVVEAK